MAFAEAAEDRPRAFSPDKRGEGGATTVVSITRNLHGPVFIVTERRDERQGRGGVVLNGSRLGKGAGLPQQLASTLELA